ncbi:MAG TPA: TIGR04255 family protein [Anaerolineae bacterium]|nr:TIGR04255 family protein [Anaerolineae bacterium]
MGRKYKNPPIVEALCEFQFESNSPWDLVMPGLIYEKVQDTFPRRRQAKQLTVDISASPEGIEQQVRTTDRMQFLREDEKVLIQVGPHFMAVNHLKPYPSWQEFLPLIKRGLRAYCDVASPRSIHRVGLRYINRIEVADQRIELEDYFEFRPFVGPNLPQDFGPFIVGIQVPYEGSRDILKLELTNASSEMPDTVAMILDFDYFLVKPGEVALNNVFEWLDIAHNRIEEAFEACITERLRQMFEEVTE